MANVKITQLPSATTPLTGTEVFPLVQGTTTKQVAITGLFTSPVMTNPTLGTVGQADLINATGLPISTGVAGLGTGIATFLGTPSSSNLRAAVTDETGTGSLVFATSPTLVTPNLGTPTFLVATNATGTALGLIAGSAITNANLTGAVTSVGNASSLGSFTSAQLLGALTDETGTGSAVFATSPTLVTPILGTPTSATLTNATGLPIATGVSGLGTGVATFLATPSSSNLRSALTDETGTGSAVFATSPTLVTPVLGTPTSATLTNATGLPLTTGVTGTLATANGGTNLTSFTSGGVVYASSTSALATGSALVFDGTNLGLGVTPKFVNGYTSFEVKDAALSSSGSSDLELSVNAYFNSGWKYINTFAASLYEQYSGYHAWYTAPSGTAGTAISFTKAMTLDASSRLMLGTTSPAGMLTVSAIASTSYGTFDAPTSGYAYHDYKYNGTRYGLVGQANALVSGGSATDWCVNASNNLVFGTGSTERAKITSDGNLLVGTTSVISGFSVCKLTVSSAGGSFFQTTGSASDTNYIHHTATSGDNRFIFFGTETSFNTVGSITYNRAGGVTLYNTTSDYRAKDISGPITGSGSLIDSVPVYMGKMKGATQERPMFIAHETPNYAHTGEKDAVDADGNPVYQQMDASALIPVMWAEIQSLRQRLSAANL